MNFPDNLLYTKEHEWLRVEGDIAIIGITDFAQKELGDIVYVDVDTVGKSVSAGDVFGTVEAVKTVSDLYMPISAEVLELNAGLADQPDLVNNDPYGGGWMIKARIQDASQLNGLMKADAYKAQIGA